LEEGPHLTSPSDLKKYRQDFEIWSQIAMSPSGDWTLVERRRRQKPAAPSQLQLHVVQERQALVATRTARLVARRSAKLKARQLQEDNLRADKEDELRLELEVRVGLELQRADLEQQVQREEARRRLSNLQQKGRAQHNITANSNAGRMKPQDNVHVVVVKEVQLPILAGASRCCSCASPSTISPT